MGSVSSEDCGECCLVGLVIGTSKIPQQGLSNYIPQNSRIFLIKWPYKAQGQCARRLEVIKLQGPLRGANAYGNSIVIFFLIIICLLVGDRT